MRILVATPTFAPLIGGLPTVSDLLATGLSTLGEDVTLITGTRATEADRASYRIVRAPGARELLRTIGDSDVVLQNTVSLRLGWPLAVLPRPLVIAHHMWLADGRAPRPLVMAKQAIVRRARNIAVSAALARSLPCRSTVIANPYDEVVFREDVAAQRPLDLAFVGRLIADKGVDVAIAALATLRRTGCTPTLSIIGDGPEEAKLRARCSQLGLDSQVTFLGPRRGPGLAAALNRHRILLIPSVWEEPFGIVALEGIACGLVPIASQSGGLPAAIGDCGVVVPKSDPSALARAIRWLCDDRSAFAQFRSGAPAHLALHTRAGVAAQYLAVLREAAGIGT